LFLLAALAWGVHPDRREDIVKRLFIAGVERKHLRQARAQPRFQEDLMTIDSPGDYFEMIAARGSEPTLQNEVGTWQIDVDGVGTWSIHVDHGLLRVKNGPEPTSTARVRIGPSELVRLARGDQHENLLTALLRGAIREVDGDLMFAQKLQSIMPLPEEGGRHEQH
jgi:hypothetical protein